MEKHDQNSVDDDDIKSLKSISDGVPELDEDIKVDLVIE